MSPVMSSEDPILSYWTNHYRRILPGLGLVALLLLHSAGIVHLGLVDRLESWTYDLRLQRLSRGVADERIVIVDIDERSLAEEGRWPWRRARVAELLDSLFDHYHAAVVGFDVVFAEPENSSALALLNRLGDDYFGDDPRFTRATANLRPQLDGDSRLAEAMRDRPVVLGYYFTDLKSNSQRRTSGLLPAEALPKNTFEDNSNHPPKMTGFGANLPLLQQAAADGGHFSIQPDPDGICRKIPTLLEYQGQYYQSFALAMVRTLLWDPPLVAGFPSQEQKTNYHRLEWLEMADLSVPVDDRGGVLVPFRGPQGSFPYLSASSILRRTVPIEKLEGAIVLVGTTAPGLMDQRATPVGSVYPGVEIHANLIAGILDQTIPHRPAWTQGAELVILALGGLLLCLLLPLLGPLSSMLLCGLLLGGALWLAQAAWHQHLVLPLASSLLLTSLLYVWNTSYGFLIEAYDRRRMTGLFGQYVPPDLVKQLSRNPEAFKLTGENRLMTVLFSDVRNFTHISEELAAEELSKMMNVYLSAMTETIHRTNGTIDKYIGDAIMAFWGAPLKDDTHARNALEAALAMQERMLSLRQEFIDRGWPALEIGIGLNSGAMNVGNMGSEFRMAYTVLGDAVNLGARLEGLTKEYGLGILVSQETAQAAATIPCTEIDRVLVKGKDHPVTIYTPCPEQTSHLTPDLANGIFTSFLTLYRERDWPAAETLLEGMALHPDQAGLARLFRQRIEIYKSSPPPDDWQGVFRFASK